MAVGGRRCWALAVLAALVAPGCWLQAGFDARRSGFNGAETGINAGNVAGLTVAWSVPVTGGSPAEPLVNGGTVYVRSNGTVQALDTATGTERWHATAGGAGQPVVADNRLWVPVSGTHCELVALDLGTGAVTASTTFGGPDFSGTTSGFSSCAAGETVAAGTRVVVPWSYFGSARAMGACLPDNTNVFGAGLMAVDVADVTVRWDQGGLGTPFCGFPPPPGPPVDKGLSSDGTDVFAVSSTGTGVAGYPVGCAARCTAAFAWSASPAVVPVVTPRPSGDEVVAVTTDGSVEVLDDATGAVHWTGALGAAADQPAAVSDTTIFAAATDGTLSAFPVGGCGATACAPTWTAQLPGAPTGRPTVAGDVLLVGDATHLTALPAQGCGAANCAALSTASAPGGVAGAPVVDDGRLFLGSTAGTITAYTPA